MKESIQRHVTSVNRETLRATVKRYITRVERMIAANGIHIEEMYD